MGSYLKNFFKSTFKKRSYFLLSLLAIVLGFATFAAFSSSPSFESSSRGLFALLVADIIVLLSFSILIARRLLKLWASHKTGLSNARLHVRLTLLFGILAAIPAVIMTLLSVLFFRFGIQDWFSTRVKTALDESVQVARSYLEEHKRLVGRDASLMAHDLKMILPQLSHDREEFNHYLTMMAALRSMTEALVFDEDHQVLGKSDLTLALEFEPVPSSIVREAEKGAPVMIASRYRNRVRALIKVSDAPKRYLFVGRAVDPKVLGHLIKAVDTASQYKTLEGKRVGFEVIFIVLFSLVALLLLMVAIWIGLVVSGQLIRPIAQLIDAAGRISKSDFSVRVPEGKKEDEISLLSRAFNRMTSQLEANQSALLDVNQKLEDRRRFIESTLAGVSSGVIGLDKYQKINLMNNAAQMISPEDMGQHYGALLERIVPETKGLLSLAQAQPGMLHEEEIELAQEGEGAKTFVVHVVAHQRSENVEGYVVTFDDVTDILVAQKQVAWSDVARRIAHEIKNPLTPIQLSAERLKRKYLGEISDAEGFKSYIEMIVKQVSYIQNMIGEFTAFARMPSPIIKKEDLVKICKDAITVQKTSYPGVAVRIDLPNKAVPYLCDDRQIGQCLMNLLKNGAEAMIESQVEDPTLSLSLKQEGHELTIEIVDNGPGFPFKEQKNFMDPYVTTRREGTGLGLSIVKKIVDDHQGKLLIDNKGGDKHGRVRLVFFAS